MRIRLISLGNKMPNWIKQAYDEYSSRVNGLFHLELKEVLLETRKKTSDVVRQRRKECKQMEAHIDANDYTIALTIDGNSWSTDQLAERVENWCTLGKNISLLVGGPEGLLPSLVERCDTCWSLSSLTLPHPIVRVLIAEQLYRVWSILHNHPYHR